MINITITITTKATLPVLRSECPGNINYGKIYLKKIHCIWNYFYKMHVMGVTKRHFLCPNKLNVKELNSTVSFDELHYLTVSSCPRHLWPVDYFNLTNRESKMFNWEEWGEPRDRHLRTCFWWWQLPCSVVCARLGSNVFPYRALGRWMLSFIMAMYLA